jgi:hypothetical protein
MTSHVQKCLSLLAKASKPTNVKNGQFNCGALGVVRMVVGLGKNRAPCLDQWEKVCNSLGIMTAVKSRATLTKMITFATIASYRGPSGNLHVDKRCYADHRMHK